MTNTVLIKRSSVANSVPLAGNLQPGELAINYNDGNLFYKNTSNVVTVIASNKFVSVSGNVTGGNIITSGAVSTSGIVGTGTVDFVSSGNISLGSVGNIHITGGSSGYVLSTNGSGTLSWVAQSGTSGGSVITVNDFTGNGVQTEFTLTVTPPSIDNTTVNYNGVIQLRTGYTLSGANVVFPTPPAAGSSIEVTTISPTISGGNAAGSNTQVQFNTGGNLDASAAFTFDSSSNTLSSGGVAGSRSNTVITTSTTIDTFPVASFRGAKYLIQGGDGTDWQAADVLLVHNTASAFITISTVCSNATSDVFSVAATVTGGNVVVSATKISSGTTTVNLTATYVKN